MADDDSTGSMADYVELVVRGEAPRPPILDFLDVDVVDAGDGSAELTFQPDERHANPMGTLHGGIICDLADAAMGFALASLLDDGRKFTTVELKSNYFKPITDQELRAVANVVRTTRSLAMVECDVFDPEDSLVARVSSTCMLLH